MHSTLRLLAAAGLLSGVLARPARANITHIQDGRMCASSTKGCTGTGPIPLEQGETRTLSVKGGDLNYCNAAAAGTNVTVTIVGTKAIADGIGLGAGQIDLRFAVGANATPGQRMVTLSNCGISGTLTFTIHIIRNGTATDLGDPPQQSNFFTQVDLTVTGTNIAGAGVRVAGATTNPVAGTQAQVISSDASGAVVRLTFSVPQSKATGQLVLFDGSFPGACLANLTFGCYGSALAYTVIGPNAVESITFPTGNDIQPGGILTIRVRLTQPAPAAGLRLPTGGTSLGGQLVKWQVHPTSSFAAETGTTFSPNVELNDFRFPAGSQQADFVVRYQTVPTGCFRSCSGTVEVRVADFRNAAPFKQTATFTLRAPTP